MSKKQPPKKSVGRPKLPPKDKKKSHSVLLTDRQREAIEKKHGTLTKAILTTIP